jgi:apolipoprotein N-acyltransferase
MVKLTRRRAAGALLGAAAMALATPPINFWPLGLVAWLPLALAASEDSPGAAAVAGVLQGSVAQAIVLAAVPAALHAVARTSWPSSCALYLALAAYEGARPGLIAFLAALAVRRGASPLAAFPLALTTAELVFPMVFPWTAALFLSGAPILLQTADIGGRLGVSLWVGVVNASFVVAWSHRRERRRLLRYGLVIPSATLGAVILYGAIAMRRADRAVAAAPAFRVGIVQGYIPDVKHETRDPTVLYRDASLPLLRAEKPDLLVWPETAIFYAIDEDALSTELVNRVFRAERLGGPRVDVPLLTGLVLRPALPRRARGQGLENDSPREVANAAVLATPDGRIRGIYEKQSLVPLGEYLPGEGSLPWLRRALPWAGRFSPGREVAPLVLGGKRILVSICYEDVLAAETRAAVNAGEPDLLVNLTSDAWFDRSRIPYLHVELAKLRAIEHRRFLVHATNTGVSAVADPAGRFAFLLSPNEPAAGVATVAWLSSSTIYERWGDTPFYGGAALLAFMVARRISLRRGARASPI